jgi:hypothetical protein
LAANHIKWAFRKDVPVSAIAYFIERAKKTALRWPITYMLNGLDHPDAVEFVVRELAETDRRLEGTGSFSPFSISATDDWSRDQEDGRRQMSAESRTRLLALWRNCENDKHIRQQAFRFRAATRSTEDLHILRSTDDPELNSSVLWQRLLRGDRDSIPALLLKLKGSDRDRKFWWQFAGHVWSGELANALEEELVLRSSSVERSWTASFSTDEQIYRLIMDLPSAQAEEMLLGHWDHLRFRDVFVQAAIYVATPSLLTNVEAVIRSCPDPKTMFKYIDHHYGYKVRGRSGITARYQLEALEPYLDLLTESVIYRFWELCNERGWFDLRRKLFDTRVDRGNARLYLDDDKIAASLDEMAADDKRRGWVDYWVKDFLKTGATPERIIATMQNWLTTQRSFSALELAATVVIQIGRRKDLHILDVPIEPKNAANALLADATFAVRRRRLS